MITTALSKNRMLAGLLFVLLLVMLYLAITRLGGKMPVLDELPPLTNTRADLVPAARVESVFQTNLWAKMQPAAGQTNLLYTGFFIPPPPPPPPVTPPPPPPPPRKVALLYQGFFETAATVRQAYLMVDSNLMLLKIGSNVVNDIKVSEIGAKVLTLTNAAGQTNVIPFRVPKEIEIPAK